MFSKNRNDTCVLKLTDYKLHQVDHCKYLGLYLDKNLDWTVHIDYVYKKILKYVGIFYKLQNKIPCECLHNIYFAFVYPYLFYGIELYANTNLSNLDKLVKLNNILLRILPKQLIL